MCMKMFFALVNNLEKSIMFSESSKYLSLSELYLLLTFLLIIIL
jgi:hypothetical protein